MVRKFGRERRVQVAAAVLQIILGGAALDNIRTLVDVGGILIVTCPNSFGLPNHLRFVMGRFREREHHVGSHNKVTLSQLLDRHGSRVTGVWTALDRPNEGVAYRAGAHVLRRIPELGGTLLVTAQLR